MPLCNFRAGKRLLYLVREIAKRQEISASRLIRRAILFYIDTLPLELFFAKKMRLIALFKQIRLFAVKYRIAGVDVAVQREILIKTLMARITEISTRIERRKTTKPQMMKQIQLLAYLVDVANGILEDTATDELLQRLKRCEELSGLGETESIDREETASPGENTNIPGSQTDS